MNLRLAHKVLKNEERYAGHQIAEAKAIVERWKRNPEKKPAEKSTADKSKDKSTDIPKDEETS